MLDRGETAAARGRDERAAVAVDRGVDVGAGLQQLVDDLEIPFLRRFVDRAVERTGTPRLSFSPELVARCPVTAGIPDAATARTGAIAATTSADAASAPAAANAPARPRR